MNISLNTELQLRWVGGTLNRLRFTHENRNYTVLLKDIKWLSDHLSTNDLYLRGRTSVIFSPSQMYALLTYLEQNIEDQLGFSEWKRTKEYALSTKLIFFKQTTQ